MKSLYHKHKCGSLVPLILLICIDVLAFEHITDDFVVFTASTTTELLVFTFSLTMTYYYLYKQHYNVRAYLKWFRNLFKGAK
jgi:hypothetical protein